MLKLSILDNVVYRVLSHLQDLGVHWVTRRQWAMAEGKGSGPARQLDLSSTYIVEDGYDLPTKFDEIWQCVEERVRLPGLAMSGTDSFRSANPSFPPSLPMCVSSTPPGQPGNAHTTRKMRPRLHHRNLSLSELTAYMCSAWKTTIAINVLIAIDFTLLELCGPSQSYHQMVRWLQDQYATRATWRSAPQPEGRVH
jgi:hypothetical protein